MAAKDISAELMAHERECAVRWEAVGRRLNRLETVIWASNAAIISGLFAIVIKVIE
tara:strand:- start:174 stop:341 length:168 start_codon:yes stop_codon:yes gene_type:complete